MTALVVDAPTSTPAVIIISLPPLSHRLFTLEGSLQGKEGSADSPHKVGLGADIELYLQALLQGLDHAQVEGDAAGEGDLRIDAYPPQEGYCAGGNGLVHPHKDIFHLLVLS